LAFEELELTTPFEKFALNPVPELEVLGSLLFTEYGSVCRFELDPY